MELRRAVENSSLEVYYQPKYQARGLKLLGGEALLRWFHPERGQIPTADFIAVAEETGLIGDIGRWALQRVCRDLCQWRSEGLELPSIAVNVSGRDFMYPEALLRLSDTVTQAHLSPSLFELELTEGVLMQDAEAGRRSLLALKEFGFALAIDDFGTGYCSLNYLKRFPLDTLKIDRSFVADIVKDPDDASIVRAIIALGHSLDLSIVAEGVSTQEQLQFLQAESCDAIQGYLMSPAIPSNAFRDLLLRPRASVDAHEMESLRRAV
jgi:EAL domain-containing protein (putative c-di-GMP-specific phosphodiesterase class I)